MKIRVLGLIVLSVIYSCSSDDNSNTPNPVDPVITDATLDGTSLTLSNVQARYFPNQKAAEITAALSDGRQLFVRYGAYIQSQMGEFYRLGYVRIADADGSNVYSTLYDLPVFENYFDGTDTTMLENGVGIEFSGKLFADPSNENSTFRYFQLRLNATYNMEPDNSEELLTISYNDYSWYSVIKKQVSASGQPLEMEFRADDGRRYKIFLPENPAIGFYNIEAASPYRVEYTHYKMQTGDYLPTAGTGLMHIFDVGPNYVKGTFNLAGNITGFGNFWINNATFSFTYE